MTFTKRRALLGAFAASPVLAVLAGVGVVLAAWYMLRLHQGLMHEPTQPATEQVTDLRRGEAWILVPLVGLMVLLGVFPRPVGDIARQSVRDYVAASQVTADAGTAGLSCATAPAPGCQVP